MEKITGKAKGQESKEQQETGAYYDMLYDFACLVSKANEWSFEGNEQKAIANKLRNGLDAFVHLCMLEKLDPNEKKIEKVSEQQKEEPKTMAEPTEPELQKEEPVEEKAAIKSKKKPLPNNFLKITPDGWGLCPVCKNKVLKVTYTTRLENFPVFCKRCRADHIVNWWNADMQRIMYKRYVSDRYVREQAEKAYKGVGYKRYLDTGVSSTERVAMKM